MQTQANEGVITRAHYLGALSSGIFIVVAGEDKDVAMTNAQDVMGNLNDTFQKITGMDGADTCDFREIGPVAILPQ